MECKKKPVLNICTAAKLDFRAKNIEVWTEFLDRSSTSYDTPLAQSVSGPSAVVWLEPNLGVERHPASNLIRTRRRKRWSHYSPSPHSPCPDPIPVSFTPIGVVWDVFTSIGVITIPRGECHQGEIRPRADSRHRYRKRNTNRHPQRPSAGRGSAAGGGKSGHNGTGCGRLSIRQRQILPPTAPVRP